MYVSTQIDRRLCMYVDAPSAAGDRDRMSAASPAPAQPGPDRTRGLALYVCMWGEERTNERTTEGRLIRHERAASSHTCGPAVQACSFLPAIYPALRAQRTSQHEPNRTEPNRLLGRTAAACALARTAREGGSRKRRKKGTARYATQRAGRGVTADCRLLARCVPVRDGPPPTTATTHVSSTDGRTGEAADRWRMPPPHGGRWSRCPRTSARARLLPPPPEGQAPAGDVSCAPSTATQVCMCEWMCGGGRCESAAATGKHAAAAASPDEHTTAHHRTPPHSTAALGRSTLHTPMQIRPWLSDRGGHGS